VETTDDVVMDGSVDSVADNLILNDPAEVPEDDDLQDDPSQESNEAEPEEPGEDLDENDSDEDSDLDEDEAEEAEDAGSQELYTVKVDGEQREVTLEDLKRSYSGQAYISKGMNEAAQQKKEAEQVYQALLNERAQASNLLNQLQSGQIMQAPMPPSRELFNNDPIGYMEAKMNYEEAAAAYNNQQAMIGQMEQSQSHQMEAARQVYLKEQMQHLAQAIPEFSDAKSAAKLKEDLLDYGARVGFSDSEIAEVVDHRALVVLQKAMKYDQIVNGKSKADQKVKGARPVVKPGAKRTGRTGKAKARQSAANRMTKTGSIDDVAKFLLS